MIRPPSLGDRFAALIGPAIGPGLAVVAVAAALGAAVLIAGVVDHKGDNARIRALANGYDLAVTADDPPEVLLARVQFLTQRGFVDEAETLIDPILASGRSETAAALFHSLGNARLRLAFDGADRQDLDAAIPQVRLAKDAYRRALGFDPAAIDLKVNLDLAMRLVRDFPELAEEDGVEDPGAKPKNLWTELPGVPEGLP